MQRKALITGITGQDGSYLAEYLLEKGYEVHGVIRPQTLERLDFAESNLAEVFDRIQMHAGSLENHLALTYIIREVRPTECYHLAGPSFVNTTLEQESGILAAIVGGTHALLASLHEYAPECRFFFAGSSEMFGQPPFTPQSEETPFSPRAMYGLAKVSAHQIVQHYRDYRDLFAVSGFMYNHESPRRSPIFVTRKVTLAAARIKLGMQSELRLGDLSAQRDWGYAPDYVDAMWRMLQSDTPRDYVIATGTTKSVEDWVARSFEVLNLDYRDFVRFDDRYFRPPEKVSLVGDACGIRQDLGWTPTKGFEDIVREMAEVDLTLHTR